MNVKLDMSGDLLLNIDDNAAGRYARTRLLQQAGYVVEESDSGEAALRKIASCPPSLVLLDVHLPDLSGLEVCRRIKANPVSAHIPVLQLSASAITPADRAGALDNGADGYLVEPVDPDVLLATVRALLRMRRAEDQLQAANAALAEANVALRQMNASLIRSNEDLQRFASIASHDLQEPIKTILSFATLLERRYRGRLDEDADEFLKLIQQGAQRMSALTRGLLTYAQVDQQSRSNWTTVNMNEIVDWALKNLEQSVMESGATVSCASLLPVRGDQIQLSQLFQNILGNGIKYRNPQLALHIEIACAASADGLIVFSISDNGMGIAPEFHDKIFAPFQRLHGHDVPGSGLGLATCQRIVERHGGRIWVESRGEGQGATFYFSLPSAKA